MTDEELRMAVQRLKAVVKQFDIECPLVLDRADIEAIKTVLQALAS